MRFLIVVPASRSTLRCFPKVQTLQGIEMNIVSSFVAATFLVSITASANAQLLMKESNAFDASLYSGGDGSSCEKAVLLMSKNEAAGVRSEYVWLKHMYPGGLRTTQGYVPPNKDGKSYDTIEYKKSDGEMIHVCFDISNLR
jgi:hypothetical protein